MNRSESLLIEKRSIKERNIAHFLLINSESIDAKDLYSKISLLYFFFCHAYKHKKQHYANFAFELLHQNLSEVLIGIQKGDNTERGAMEFGWGLIRFVKNGFFESDELDEILLPFDQLCIQQTERLSRGEFSSHNVHGLLSVAAYLFDRIGHLDERSEHVFAIREHLLIAFFELIHHIESWDRQDITWMVLMGSVLEKSKRRSETAHLVRKGLRQLKNVTMPNNEQILDQYKSAKAKEDLDRALLLSLSFSGKIRELMDDKSLFREAIDVRIAHDMEQLYKNGNDTPLSNMRRLITYALALIEGHEPKDLPFLTHLIIELIREQ